MNLSNIYVKLGLVGVAAVLFGVLTYAGLSVHYSNTEIDLRKEIEAQQQNSKVTFDTTWKIIKQQAQVTEQAKDSFKDIYTSIMSERYGNEGAKAFMLWIKEENPNFDMSMYNNLMSSIEAQRKSFQVEQKMLIDLKREHDALLLKFPSNFFVGDREQVEIMIVTSEKTEATFTSGKENDVDLFKE